MEDEIIPDFSLIHKQHRESISADVSVYLYKGEEKKTTAVKEDEIRIALLIIYNIAEGAQLLELDITYPFCRLMDDLESAKLYTNLDSLYLQQEQAYKDSCIRVGAQNVH